MIAGWVAVFTELLTAIAPLECQKAPQGRPWRWLNIGGQRIADRRKHGFGKATGEADLISSRLIVSYYHCLSIG